MSIVFDDISWGTQKLASVVRVAVVTNKLIQLIKTTLFTACNAHAEVIGGIKATFTDAIAFVLRIIKPFTSELSFYCHNYILTSNSI